MIWESGKLLTAEQTARLARMNGEDRDRKVQLIAERLRKHAENTQLRHGARPQHRFAAHIGDDVI
jgi:hypothetical protein